MPVRQDQVVPPARRSRRPGARLAAPVLLVALGLTASGCYSNQDAASQKDYQSADGSNGDSGLLRVRNVQVVSTGNGGTLVGAIANDGTDRDTLTSITVAGRPTRLTLTSQVLLPQTLVSFGTAGGPQAFVTGAFTPGAEVPVVVTFGTAGPVQLVVPVSPRFDYSTGVPTAGASVAPVAPSATLGATPVSPGSTAAGGTPEPGSTGGVPNGN